MCMYEEFCCNFCIAEDSNFVYQFTLNGQNIRRMLTVTAKKRVKDVSKLEKKRVASICFYIASCLTD